MPLEKQVMVLYAAINGYIDDVPVNKVVDFETNFYRSMEARYPKIGKAIAEEKDISPETEKALKEAISEFKKGFLTE
jgi:F-type H+-transporting ATPase subunit alpha